MSISSDVLKQPFSQLNPNADTQTNAREFQNITQEESKVVRESADINGAGSENGSSDKKLFDEKNDSESTAVSPEPEDVNQKMRQLNVSLSFEMSEESGENVVKVLDRETGELVRQIPSEEFLKISKRIDDIFEEVSDLKGSLINSEV